MSTTAFYKDNSSQSDYKGLGPRSHHTTSPFPFPFPPSLPPWTAVPLPDHSGYLAIKESMGGQGRNGSDYGTNESCFVLAAPLRHGGRTHKAIPPPPQP